MMDVCICCENYRPVRPSGICRPCSEHGERCSYCHRLFTLANEKTCAKKNTCENCHALGEYVAMGYHVGRWGGKPVKMTQGELRRGRAVAIDHYGVDPGDVDNPDETVEWTLVR